MARSRATVVEIDLEVGLAVARDIAFRNHVASHKTKRVRCFGCEQSNKTCAPQLTR